MKRKYVHLDLEDAEKLFGIVIDLRRTPMYRNNHENCRYHRDGLALVEDRLKKEIDVVRRSQGRGEEE